MIPVALALVCQVAISTPEHYTASLIGPDSKNKYSLVLTSQFYQMITPMPFKLTRTGDEFEGKSRKYGTVKLTNFKKKSPNQYSFVFETSPDGAIREMNCTQK